MLLRVPYYYKEFKCIAGDCKDSCCVGWEIDIDEDTFAYYRGLEGPFGDRLRASMARGEENTFVLNQGRCPFLNQQNLCDICLELGEEALCQVCTEYPRFVTEYGEVTEKSLALSCEVVGGLVFGRRDPIYCEEIFQQDCYGEEAEEEENLPFIPQIEQARDLAIDLIQDRTRPIEARICRMLKFAQEFQEALVTEKSEQMEKVLDQWKKGSCWEKDEEKTECKSAEEEKKRAAEFAFQSFFQRIRFFKEMEVLDREWEEARDQVESVVKEAGSEGYLALQQEFMETLRRQDREYEYEHLCVYFLFRYAIQTVYDWNFWGHGAAAAACFLMIRDMDMARFVRQGGKYTLEDRIDVARIFSKEAEHSEENLEYLLEGAYYETFMKMDNLLRQVAGKEDGWSGSIS
ncbi:MAG TPA: flagellin lysine-N-methylase [Candidatus Cottocaccamicrobium excrementipullorum]|nr:flagellin lysine-N-methylase [Candidatus Cottocaccamicrobium excrementipullorum]